MADYVKHKINKRKQYLQSELNLRAVLCPEDYVSLPKKAVDSHQPYQGSAQLLGV